MNAKMNRITSIDALRAVVLLGILLVHINNGFGFHLDTSSIVGSLCKTAIALFLSKRCASVFGILFGVSFYLILRKPNYSSWKFVWRCVLLIGIGIFNKIFYTWDALLWYGIWGAFLVPFRYLSLKKLWIVFVFFYIINLLISNMADLSNFFFISYTSPYNRYSDGNTIADVITYPIGNSILDYIEHTIRGPLGTFVKFLLGYCIARSGIIDNIESYSKLKFISLFAICYIVLALAGSFFGISWLSSVSRLCGSICYAIIFLWLYYKKSSLFHFLEPYGKLGLTNYSFQGIIGVVICAVFLKPQGLTVEWLFVMMLGFYIFQVIFSIIWLKHYQHGPLEYLWRCATERKMFANKK